MNAQDPLGLLSSKDSTDPLGLLSSPAKVPEAPKEQTTFLEDIGMSLNNAAQPVVKFGGLVGGGAASLVGATDTADSIYKGMEDMSKSMEDYWVPKNKEQGLGGLVAGTLATLPAQVVSAPFSPADTGQRMLEAGESLDKAQTGSLLDTLGNVVGFKFPNALGEKLGARVLSGAGINMAQDAAVRKAISSTAETQKIQDQFQITPESMVVSGLTGGLFGAMAPPASVAKQQEAMKTLNEKLAGKNSEAISDLELNLLKEHHKHNVSALSSLSDTKTQIENIIRETGDASPEVVKTLQEVDQQIDFYLKRIEGLEQKLADPKLLSDAQRTDVLAQNDQALINKINELKAKRKPKDYPPQLTPEEEDRQLASVLGHDDTPPIGQPRQSVNVLPKQSPVEVALTKIGQAINDPRLAAKYRAELQDKLDVAMARPESAGPGGDYNARLAAMQEELKAYDAIARGEQPDLSWFNNEAKTDVEAPRINEQTPVDTQVLPDYLKALDQEIPVDTQNLYRQKQLADEGMFGVDPYWNLSKEGTTTPHEPWEAGLGENNLNFAEANTPKTIDAYKPQSALNKAKYELNTAQSHLDRVNKQLANAEHFDPGTVDLAKLHEQRQMFESLVNKYSEGVQRILRDNPSLIKDAEFAGTKEAVSAEESLVTQPVQYKSVQEALDSGQVDIPFVLETNSHLFNVAGEGKIFIDKDIPEVQQKILTHYLEKLGLLKDKIFFVHDNNLESTGRCSLYGNTSVIRLNKKQTSGRIVLAHEKSKGLLLKLGEKMTNTAKHFHDIRVMAHEIGHYLLTKIVKEMSIASSKQKIPFNEVPLIKKLQEEFDKLTKKDLTPVGVYDLTTDNRVVENQKFLHEYFAEQVSKELLYHNTLTAFTNNKGSWINKFGHMMSVSMAMLRQRNIDIDRVTFGQQMVRDLISENKQALETTSKTIWENFQLKATDKQIFQGMTLAKVSMLEGENTNWHKYTSGGDDFGTKPDKGLFSLSAVNQLVSKVFSKNSMSLIFKDNPHIAKVYSIFRDAERSATTNSKTIWFGKEAFSTFESKSVLTRFSDIKDGNSPYHTVKKISNLSAHKLHNLFKQGFEEGLEYHETLAKYGGDLSQEERKAFNTLSKMFEQQYDGIVNKQIELNKKNVLERRPGWYPSELQGEWFVTIKYDDGAVHREHFATKTAADAFVSKTQKENFKFLTVDEPQRRSFYDVLNDKEEQNAQIEAVCSMLEQKYKTAGPKIVAEIKKLQQTMLERGGKAGMHHEKRSNISGYKGSELFNKPEDLGRSFKEAIIKSVDAYSGQLRKMEIKTKVLPMLLREDIAPETKMIIQQMVDNDFSLNKNYMDGIDSPIREFVERRVKSLMDSSVAKLFGVEYTGRKAALDSMVGGSLTALYLMKIMAKGAFILSQPMSSLQAIRHMSYDGGYIKPWYHYGKGVLDLVAGNKELKQAMYKSKQQSNVFEPQFIDSLHLTEEHGPLITGIFDWVMLRRPAEIADTLSRAMTYAAMFSHYRSKGHSFDQAVKLAERGTDSTMVVYGNRDAAAVFQHAGFTGNMVRPLQTFPTAALGNLVADLKNMSLKDYKSFAPVVNYALTTIVLSGVMGLQFIAEYEMIRKWMEDKNPGSGPPAVADIMLQDESFEDRVQPDPSAWQKAMLLGVPAQVTGVDLASSLRSNETFATTLVGIATGQKAWYEAMPLVGLVSDVTSGVATLGKAKLANTLGIEGGDLTVAEKAKAIDKAAPAGVFGYGFKEIAGVNETKLFGENTGMKQGGKEGEATTERTTTDKVAGYLGTKSTEDRTNLLVNMRKQELDKRRTEQIKKNANLFIETGKTVYLDRLTALDVTDKQLENTLSNAAYKKLIDQRYRYMMNKQGKVNDKKAERAFQYGDIPE